jgi:hypothetical protein
VSKKVKRQAAFALAMRKHVDQLTIRQLVGACPRIHVIDAETKRRTLLKGRLARWVKSLDEETADMTVAAFMHDALSSIGPDRYEAIPYQVGLHLNRNGFKASTDRQSLMAMGCATLCVTLNHMYDTLTTLRNLTKGQP